jgi:hypothetical protein
MMRESQAVITKRNMLRNEALAALDAPRGTIRRTVVGMIRPDDIRGVDDVVAELALARRERLRALARRPSSPCGRRFKHLREPGQRDLQIETCVCLLPSGHAGGCICEHGIERRVYRVDSDGREHYATRSLEGPSTP